jgi:hypothetical protein
MGSEQAPDEPAQAQEQAREEPAKAGEQAADRSHETAYHSHSTHLTSRYPGWGAPELPDWPRSASMERVPRPSRA